MYKKYFNFNIKLSGEKMELPNVNQYKITNLNLKSIGENIFKNMKLTKLTSILVSTIFLIIGILFIVTYKNRNHNTPKKYYPYSNGTAKTDYLPRLSIIPKLIKYTCNNVFLYINDLIFISESFQDISEEDNLHKISNALKIAKSYGVTDLMLPESSIDIENIASLKILSALVHYSTHFSITINLLLNEQFTVAFKNKYKLEKNIFTLNSNGKLIMTEKGLIFNLTNEAARNFTRNRIAHFIACGIKNFYMGENPYTLPENPAVSNLYEAENKIDYESLRERSKQIYDISNDISLSYLYDSENTKIKIKSSNVKYKGGMFRISWRKNEKLPLDEISLSQMFLESHSESKVLLFEIFLFKSEYELINILIGLYLFSPVPIILKSDAYFCHIFLDQIISPKIQAVDGRFKAINIRFQYVLKVKRLNIFFEKNSYLLEDVQSKDGIVTAIRGIVENDSNITELLFMVYNKSFKKTTVDIKEIFKLHPFTKYTILYDSSTVEKSSFTKTNGKILFLARNIMIILPHLDTK